MDAEGPNRHGLPAATGYRMPYLRRTLRCACNPFPTASRRGGMGAAGSRNLYRLRRLFRPLSGRRHYFRGIIAFVPATR